VGDPVKKLWLFVLVVVFVAVSSAAFAGQPPQQEGFVPVDQLPGQEQMPAAPLVAAAYGVAWAAVLVYVWTVWRRLAKVERELADVSRRIQPGAR
jgi:CcmD family protein